MEAAKPQAIFLAAGKVGGIHANATQPADFLYDNVMIEANIIHAAWRIGAEKLLFLGSSCIYPKLAPQPMAEEALLTGPLEPTNEWYAVAKIAGIRLCEAYRRQHGCDFISAMPTNLYGPGDNYHPMNSHVIGALLSRMHRAKIEGTPHIEIWGSGQPLREFLFVDDLADALVFLMKNYSAEPHINVGSGQEVSIADLASTIAKVVGYKGTFAYDSSRPDGSPRKLLNSDRLHGMGWRAGTGLEEGLRQAYDWYAQNIAR